MFNIVTHSGAFQADDVMAVAVLERYANGFKSNWSESIIRTRDQVFIDCRIGHPGFVVVDVGGVYDPERNAFDHHQRDYKEARECGVPYAAAGLVWKTVGRDYIKSYIETDDELRWLAHTSGYEDLVDTVTDAIDWRVFRPIDAIDNGYKIPEIRDAWIGKAITCNLPIIMEASKESYDKEFIQSVVMADRILRTEIRKVTYEQISDLLVDQYGDIIENGRVLVLTRPVFTKRWVVDHPEILFTVLKDPDGNWRCFASNVSMGSFELRKPFPKEWAGLRDQELEETSGITGAKFCHKNLFVFVSDNKAACLEAALKAIAA